MKTLEVFNKWMEFMEKRKVKPAEDGEMKKLLDETMEYMDEDEFLFRLIRKFRLSADEVAIFLASLAEFMLMDRVFMFHVLRSLWKEPGEYLKRLRLLDKRGKLVGKGLLVPAEAGTFPGFYRIRYSLVEKILGIRTGRRRWRKKEIVWYPYPDGR